MLVHSFASILDAWSMFLIQNAKIKMKILEFYLQIFRNEHLVQGNDGNIITDKFLKRLSRDVHNILLGFILGASGREWKRNQTFKG